MPSVRSRSSHVERALTSSACQWRTWCSSPARRRKAWDASSAALSFCSRDAASEMSRDRARAARGGMPPIPVRDLCPSHRSSSASGSVSGGRDEGGAAGCHESTSVALSCAAAGSCLPSACPCWKPIARIMFMALLPADDGGGNSAFLSLSSPSPSLSSRRLLFLAPSLSAPPSPSPQRRSNRLLPRPSARACFSRSTLLSTLADWLPAFSARLRRPLYVSSWRFSCSFSAVVRKVSDMKSSSSDDDAAPPPCPNVVVASPSSSSLPPRIWPGRGVWATRTGQAGLAQWTWQQTARWRLSWRGPGANL